MDNLKRPSLPRSARVALLAAALIALGLLVVQWFVLDWKIIPPGYTGVKINRLVDQGITRSHTVTGFVFYNPVQTQLVVYPTFIQRVVWTRDLHEGNPLNEELTFNTKDAVPVTLDVAVSYGLDAVNLKTRAIQESIRAENEVRTAQAEAKKRVAIAEGEAAANRALLLSLDPKLFEWERLKLQHEAIQRWNGVSPSVMGGGNGMIFNIPVQTEK